MPCIINRLVVATLVAALGLGCSKDSKPGTTAATGGQGQKTDARPDEELLQGTWVMISFEKDGRNEKDVAKGRVIIKGAELSLGRRASPVTLSPSGCSLK